MTRRRAGSTVHVQNPPQAMMPDRSLPSYYFSIPVRYADTDAQTHVFFANYFTYLDEAYMAYLAEVGFSWDELAKLNLETYYVNAECRFLGRAFYGDVLHVHTSFSKLGNSSLVTEMTIVNASRNEIVAKGQLTSVMIDSRTEKSTPIPDAFRAAVDKYQGKGWIPAR